MAHEQYTSMPAYFWETRELLRLIELGNMGGSEIDAVWSHAKYQSFVRVRGGMSPMNTEALYQNILGYWALLRLRGRPGVDRSRRLKQP